MNAKGNLLIISGPSGAGKGTLLKQAMADDNKIKCSVSATTRKPRAGELNGVHYLFISHIEFKNMIKKNELVEWVEYCGNYYGTPKIYIENNISQGNDIILEIETQGAMKIKETFPQSILIFIAPPSIEELRKRLTLRGTEKVEVINKRIARAKEELKLIKNYDYIIINDKLDESTQNLKKVIESQRFRIANNIELIHNF